MPDDFSKIRPRFQPLPFSWRTDPLEWSASQFLISMPCGNCVLDVARFIALASDSPVPSRAGIAIAAARLHRVKHASASA